MVNTAVDTIRAASMRELRRNESGVRAMSFLLEAARVRSELCEVPYNLYTPGTARQFATARRPVSGLRDRL